MRALCVGVIAAAGVLGGCATARVGAIDERRGDEIVVAGKFVHTGVPVVLWMDPGGYDGYRVERRFVPADRASWDASKDKLGTPNRFGPRTVGMNPAEIERVRGGGWDLGLLQRTVTQFVIHYDVCGTSRTCFQVLHDQRGLSVHFLLDIDGTIYQTLDVKERAWHAGEANDRSVGVEIANIGAYPAGKPSPLDQWYKKDAAGRVRIVIPSRLGDGGVRTPGFVGRPARPDRIHGMIQGTEYEMYDLTTPQYESLAHLTAALCTVLPRIRCDYPRNGQGELVRGALTGERLAAYRGLLGHFHVTTNKIDPGPAFDWERVVIEAQTLMGSGGGARP